VLENRVLWRIFGPGRYEVTGDWMKVHNNEIRKCNWNDQIKEDEMGLNFFFIYLVLPAALGPGAYSASIRNDY
jgi:hypothetical protein